ncbi:Uncharacterised protein [Mycobacteroides abscessus]|nr:Uncharacterised protein [Mycobacteroides abscessus]
MLVTASNLGAMMSRCLRMWARTPSASPKNSACRSWLTLSGPMDWADKCFLYQATFPGDDARNATPAPANVIFDVEA